MTGHAPQDNAHLDTVAFSLCTVARIYATDPLTKLLFPVVGAELLRGRFQGGAERFLLDGDTSPVDVPPMTRL